MAERIDDVIEEMTAIVDEARQRHDRRGYFTALYRRVTIEVKRGIEQGRFENPELMERLDVIFARRYLDAFYAYNAGQPLTSSWRVAFGAANQRRPIILQHLFLGMNAHINLDLGVSAARAVERGELPLIKRDFYEINTVLGEMVDVVQDRIGLVSPWMRLIDKLGGRADEAICRIFMDIARHNAWKLAEQLNAAETEDAYFEEMQQTDQSVSSLGRRINKPDPVTQSALLLVRARESRPPAHIITSLQKHVLG